MQSAALLCESSRGLRMLTTCSSSFSSTSTSSLSATSLPLLGFQLFRCLNCFWIPHCGVHRDMSRKFWIVGFHGYSLPTCTIRFLDPVQERERDAGRNAKLPSSKVLIIVYRGSRRCKRDSYNRITARHRVLWPPRTSDDSELKS